MPPFTIPPGCASAACCLAAALAAEVTAGQLAWSLPFTEAHRLSDGTTPIPAGTVFQLGVFEGSFVPNSGNQSEWSAHWRAADFTTLVEISGLTGLGGDYTPNGNPPPYSAGKQMYVWGVHLKTDGSSEQWLATSTTWQVPSANPVELPVYIDIDDATTLLLGTADSTAGTIRMQALTAGASLPLIYGSTWRDHYFNATEIANPGISGWQADPDYDGLGNALEFLMGTDPRDTGSRDRVNLQQNPGGLLLACPGWALAVVDAGVEESATLQPPWLPLGTPGFNPGTSRWELQISITGPCRFLRMAVAIPEMP
jgi:hypothetical protein